MRELRVLAVGMIGSCLVACGSGDRANTPPPVANPSDRTGNVLLDRDGVLDVSDQHRAASFVDRFDVPVSAGERVRVSVSSNAFDTVVEVTPPRGLPLSNDDAAGDRTRSEVELVSPAEGALKVQVTSFVPGAQGAYHVRVERVRDPATVNVPRAAPAARNHHVTTNLLGSVTSPTSVRLGERVSGSLSESDARLDSGEYADIYVLDVREPQDLRISMESTEVDSYLLVIGPTQSFENDDSGGALDAEVHIAAAPPGSYRIVATSYRPGMRGRYELKVLTSRDAAPTGSRSAGEGVQITQGALAAGDRTLSSGEFTDEYRFVWPVGRTVHLEARSTDFDSYLIVRAPSGEQQDNDDQSPGVVNAALELAVREAGEYRVLVTSYRPGETGSYTLAVREDVSTGAAAALANAPAPTPGAGGSGSRVWVLSIGISDYPGGDNDLPECANDAVKIAEALRNQGLTTPEREILLTNSQATVSAIRAGMQRIASQIRTDETFVFFYSGHGGQTATQSNDIRELDGRDEHLVAYDGELADDEFGRLTDAIRARTALVAIDACFAGGFAKDVITRPGVVGMFSSEEDVTSAVAGQFQAGGYLSHFLRLGIQGEADEDPRDRVLTVGELTHFVWQQYGRHASSVRMQMGYQHLVVDRGAVHTTQELWRANR